MKFLKFTLLVCFISQMIPPYHGAIAAGAEHEFKDVASEVDKHPGSVQPIQPQSLNVSITQMFGELELTKKMYETVPFLLGRASFTQSMDPNDLSILTEALTALHPGERSRVFTHICGFVDRHRIKLKQALPVTLGCILANIIKSMTAPNILPEQRREISDSTFFLLNENIYLSDEPVLIQASALIPPGERKDVCKDIRKLATKNSGASFLAGLMQLVANVPSYEREDIYTFVHTFLNNMSAQDQLRIIDKLKMVPPNRLKALCNQFCLKSDNPIVLDEELLDDAIKILLETEKEAPAEVYNSALSLLAHFISIKHMSADDKPILSKALAALPHDEHENVCEDISRHFTKSSRWNFLDGEHENAPENNLWFSAKRDEFNFLVGLIQLAAHVPADQREDIYTFVSTFTANMGINPQLAVIETLTKVVRADECKEVCDSVRILLSRFMGCFVKPPRVAYYDHELAILATYIEIVATSMPAGQRMDMCDRAQRCFTGKEDLRDTDDWNFQAHLMDFLKDPSLENRSEEKEN